METHRGPPPPDVLIGQTIGNYLVTQKLGEGGMGAVYLAEHPTIGKKVALKVLHSEFSTNQDVAQRFFHEAKAVNDIGHPNIVDIVDYGILQGGMGTAAEQLVYFIMEYLAGQTLSGLIRAEAPLPPERALAIALQVGDALAASHKCGIVHRDLKPDNIILISRHRERDFVKLLDFGIAKLSNDAQSTRTRTGIVMGTPAYMSPEQCEGKGNIDNRTDIYALGIVLYEMLVGRVPFIGESYGDILVQHLSQMPIPPSQYRMLNPHVEAVVMKALQKNPSQRYPTMDEFMRAMGDPIGYVEAHGGIAQFMAVQLMPSNAPLPPTRPQRLTGAGGYQPTPPPGSVVMPAVAGAAPTTMGASNEPVEEKKSKTGFIVAGAIVVAAAVAGIVIVLNSGHKKVDVTTSEPSGSAETPSGSAVAVVVDAAAPAMVVDAAGSAAVAVVVDAAGSAELTIDAAGSAAVAVVVDAGVAVPVDAAVVAAIDAGVGSAATVATTYTFTIRTKPAGAKILIGGKDSGVKTPDSFKLDAGAKPRVTLRLSGYKDYSFNPSGSAGVDKDVTLTKAGGGAGSGSNHGGSNDTSLMLPE